MRLTDSIEGYIKHDNDEFISGPSVAFCPRKGIAGEGDMILTFDRREDKRSNLKTSIFRSSDNGLSWKFQMDFEHQFVYDLHGSNRRDGYGSLFADTLRGVLIYFGTELYFEHNNSASPDTMRKIYYRLSFDNGFTWSDKRQIIQKGISAAGQIYDKTHYMHSVRFGSNMANLVVPNVVRAKDLSLLIGVCSQQVDDSWRPVRYIDSTFMRSGALKAIWNPSALGYDFSFGEWASVGVDKSTRGIFEPVLAQVNGGRTMMLTRGSNAERKDMIGCKFISLSMDEGLTWSAPEPLLYEDGSVVYSSSSGARLLAHGNGKLYYIGVINDKNPVGNLPRYPLCIAEIDKYSCRMKKRSLLCLATKPDSLDDDGKAFYADYTGHWAYEDKDGKIIVLTSCRPNLSKFGGWLNRYEIEV